MNWKKLDEEGALKSIAEESVGKLVLVFKHSTRCSISSMALDRLQRSWDEKEMNDVTPYYLDLISYKSISNEIENKFGVVHQSPQVILLKNGKAIYDESHMGISYNEIKKIVSSFQ